MTDLLNNKILVVEDDIDNLEYFKRLLLIKGADVIYAKTGEEAIDIVKKDDSIRLVLMDILLPGMDGLETTKQLKKLNPRLPIIAQTAYAMQNDKEKCINAGCDDYVSKPIDTNLLILKMKHLLQIYFS
ncbi:MAG: hypothetical protein A2041_02750 [Bacteroidetes bacterium GWA2_31_9b]|nr:MAG: hypothetical protein A2041_02750 [Bacteroidetes bacterium GWA2_31_9b]